MDVKNYTHESTVSAPASQVYKALSRDLGHWWGISKEGVRQEGDIMRIAFAENPSYWVFQASELVEPARVVLTCIEALHIHPGLPDSIRQEWKGSQLIMNISEEESKSRVIFTHQGLSSELVCYDICVEGWNYFMGKGLEDYVQRLQAASA